MALRFLNARLNAILLDAKVGLFPPCRDSIFCYARLPTALYKFISID